jgi:hypothetical protein
MTKRKVKVSDYPALANLAEQYLKGDREDKQIIWMEMKDQCEDKDFSVYSFFDEFCKLNKVGAYEGTGKKKQKKFSKKDLRKRNKERG